MILNTKKLKRQAFRHPPLRSFAKLRDHYYRERAYRPVSTRIYRTDQGDTYNVGETLWIAADGTVVDADVPLLEFMLAPSIAANEPSRLNTTRS